MISFQKLTKYGRLGNQLFQYAFLRITARRLGVKFYCQTWIGDSIFQLNDNTERSQKCYGIIKKYHHRRGQFCFAMDTFRIEDNTDIEGYYQTEKYFHDKDEVRSWYTFKDETIEEVRSKYKSINFSNSVGLHLRLGDWVSPSGKVSHRYIPSFSYYVRGLALVRHKNNILVFSDDIIGAKAYFRSLKGNVIFMKDNKPHEDLYLMSRCRNFISSPSTLSWWAAWLNPYDDKRIIVPQEGPLRYSQRYKRDSLKDYWPKEFHQIRSLSPMMDNYDLALFMVNARNRAIGLREILQRKFDRKS